MEKIQIGDYFLFFSKKTGTKSIRLRFDKSGNLLLTAPWHCPQKKAVAFAQQNLEWIQKQMEQRVLPRKFQKNEVVSLLGKEYQICYNPQHKGGVQICDDKLLIGGDEAFLHRRIIDFAKKIFDAYTRQKAFELAAILNEKPHKITLRNTSSRWGSCSSRKDLNFCWKLVFAPLFVVDYIIAHEVSHLKEMNHSPAFWATVALLNVEQANAQIWLRKNGKTIQAII